MSTTSSATKSLVGQRRRHPQRHRHPHRRPHRHSIPYRVIKVNMNAFGLKPTWYTRLVDGGKLPAIELDGAVHVESIPIMRLLDETFPHAPRMVPPAASDEAEDFDRYMHLEKEMVGGMHSRVLTSQ